MKLENQVCTLEQAKRLEELLGEGIKSTFYWVDWNGMHVAQPCSKGFVCIGQDGDVYTETIKECFNAYTVAELGIMLPIFIPPSYSIGFFSPNDFHFAVRYVGFIYKEGATEAQARAAMLIHILECGYVTAEQINNRILEYNKLQDS